MQRSHPRMPGIGYMAMAMLARSNAMSSPEMVATSIKKRIPLAFKRRLPRCLPHQKTRVLEPSAQMLLLRLTLLMSKAGDSRNAMLNQRRMGNKDHIRRSGTCMQQTNVSNTLQMVVKILPLSEGHVTRRPVKIPSHPWVDDVVDVIKLRGAHQIGWAVKMG
ncbi:MAG: hypothetical protein JWQ42_1324 [Edaphobacter sp.]|nr:hypothetical protein [Edaphobacter sp.]